MSTRYVVVTEFEDTDLGQMASTVHGPWRDHEKAQAFADKVNARVDQLYEAGATYDEENDKERTARARVLTMQAPRITFLVGTIKAFVKGECY